MMRVTLKTHAQLRQPPCENQNFRVDKTTSAASNMAAHGELLAPATVDCGDVTVFSPVALSADTAPFFPASYNGWRARPASDAEKQFFRCTERLRCLRPDTDRLREELNLLFDQLLSESYNLSNEPSTNIQPEVTHTSLALLYPLVAI